MKEIIKVFVLVSASLFLALLAGSFLIYETNAAIIILLVLWTLTSLLALIGFIPILGQMPIGSLPIKSFFQLFLRFFRALIPPGSPIVFFSWGLSILWGLQISPCGICKRNRFANFFGLNTVQIL